MTELEKCWKLDETGETETALQLALRLRAKATKSNELEAIAMSSQCAAWLLRHLGRSVEGVEHIQEARRIWTQLGNESERARSGAIFAWLLMEFGDDDVAAPEAADAYFLAQSSDDRALLAFVGNVYAISLNQAGDYAEAAEISKSALAIARRCGAAREVAGQLIDRAYIFTCMADAYKEAGDDLSMSSALREAVAWNEEAIGLASSSSDFWKLRIALSNGASLYAKSGAIELAENRLQEWRKVPGTPHGRLLREYEYAKCEVLIAQGALEDARAIAELSVEKGKLSGTPHQEASFIKRLADLCEQLGDAQAALKYYKMYHGAHARSTGDALKRRRRFTELRKEISDLRIAVAQARKQASELAEEASIDPLTGIANRRAFDRELQRLIDANEAISLALMDLDHFKLVNDEFSHLIGDDVLRIVGRQLKNLCRSGDLVARFGGEEFVLLFQKATLLEAAEICERFRTTLSEYPWGSVAPGLQITVSVGISSREEADSVRMLVELADRRLYAAKLAGRNCVVGDEAFTACRTH